MCNIIQDNHNNIIQITTFFNNSFHFQAVDWLIPENIIITHDAINAINDTATTKFINSFINHHISDQKELVASHSQIFLGTQGRSVLSWIQSSDSVELDLFVELELLELEALIEGSAIEKNGDKINTNHTSNTINFLNICLT